MDSSKDESKKAAKPSLFGATEDPASTGAACSSILTELENGAKPGIGKDRARSGPSKPGHWKLPLAGTVAAALIAGAVTLTYIDGDKPDTQADAATAQQTGKPLDKPIDTPAEKIAASKDAPPTSVASSADASQDAAIAKVGEEEGANAAGLAALIVNEPAEAPKENKEKELSKKLFGSDTKASTPAKPASAQAVASHADKHAEKTKTAQAASAHAQLASKATTKDKQHAAPKALAQAHGSSKTPAARAPKQNLRAPANDSDVALLAAIVAHDKGRFAASDDKVDSARSTTVKAQVKARDIVERKAGDSTESLLQRCKRLGSPEGDLCRTRICSGQWSAETACTVTD